MFCRFVAVISFIAATSNVVVVVDAASTGASACPPGFAATTGPGHAVPEGGAPTFAAKGYEIVLDEGKDTVMVVGDSDMAQVLAEVMYTVSVRATDSMFRGALIRLEGDGTLEPGANSQVADACSTFDGVAGVTHTDATEKDILTGTMMIMGDSVLDVTVVESNNNVDGSVYSYRQVQLQVMAAPPSSAPITLVEPTASTPAPPTAEPTTVPKPGPPISAPTAPPTATAATTPTSTTSSKAPTMGKEPAAGKGPTVVMAPTTPGGTPPTAPVATASTTTTAKAPVAAPTASSAPIILTTTGFMAGVVGSVIWSMF